MAGFKEWTLEERKRLQLLVKEGYNIVQIEKLTGLSRYLIRTELKRGLEDDDYKNKLYAKYSIKKAIESEARKYLGDSIDYLLGVEDEE